MRQKAYYTVSEITTNLYTAGKEWQLETGAEYVGLYHKYLTGEVYTQAMWNPSLSKKLVPYQQVTAETQANIIYKTLISPTTDYKTPVVKNVTPKPNTQYYDRFFIKKVNDLAILEIDETQYNDWKSKKIDPNLYVAVKLKWYISGNIDDVTTNGVVAQGVRTKNFLSVRSAEQSLPGITVKLNNLIQYYTDTDFVVPKDINA